MVDLDELKRLAVHATPGAWFYQEQSDVYTHIVRPVASPGMIIAHFPQSRSPMVEGDARFCAAMSPDTAKKLIAVALAAQAVLKETPDEWGAIPKLRKALRELAGSPQERRE